jgi:cytohesin
VPSAPDISIHDAAFDGNIEVVKQHLAAGTDVNAKAEGRATPLMDAARKGHKEIVELLIAKGADVNAKAGDAGSTPLHIAADRGHKEVVALLIDKGADVNMKEEDGTTPLDYAEGEIADLLRKHGGKTEEELKAAEPVVEAAQPEPPTAKAPDITIHRAVMRGDIKAVKQHLGDGADVNATDEVGFTPLHNAVTGGHKEIVELLITKGADVNAKNKRGDTPLYLAAWNGRKVIAELLIAKGVDVNAIDAAGETPLDATYVFNKTETADLLRKHGGKTSEELKAEGK